MLIKPLQLKAAFSILKHFVFTDTTAENHKKVIQLSGFGKDVPVGCFIGVDTSPESVTDIIAR